MATSQDVGVLTRKLGAADYDPGKYVAEISQRCVGGEEVLQQRKVIQVKFLIYSIFFYKNDNLIL